MLCDYKKIIVFYSGGKDSTLVTHMALEIAKKLNLKVTIVTSDTQVEIPWVWKNTTYFLHKIDTWAREFGLDIKTKVVTPSANQTFWATLIGKGYVMPHFRFRWCVRLLKILPMKSFLNENRPALILMGTRWGESTERDRNMKKRKISENWIKYTGIENSIVYLPIANWRADEVLSVLSKMTTPWGTAYSGLFNNGLRFGCWTCSVVRKDKALCSFIDKGYNAAKQLLKFKNFLVKVTWSPKNRVKTPKGPGKLKKEVREYIFKQLISFSADMENFIPNYQILSEREKNVIRMMLDNEV